MILFPSIDPGFAISGFVVGALVGITGVGGGSLMTPILILVFGIHPATAVGTDLLYASVTKTAGTAVHGWNGTVEWPVVAWLAAGSVPMTALTLFLLAWVGIDTGATDTVVTWVLSLALCGSAVVLIFRSRIEHGFGKSLAGISAAKARNLTIFTGMALGVLVSLSSVGAGALGATALMLLYPRLPMSRIVGSDIAHAVPLTLVAGIGHWAMGSVDWALMGVLLIGSLPGIV